MRRKERLLLIFLLLQISQSALSLRLCTRKHYKIHSDAILQRVELGSAEKCVERCIENMEYCLLAEFTKSENKGLGICTLYNETSDVDIHPDATLDPLSVIYQFLKKCPPFTASDITHRISMIHRKVLEENDDSETNRNRLSDSFFPENREHIGGGDEFALDNERYAVMKSIEEIEIEATKSTSELPRDPFNDGPRFHQSSREIDRGSDSDRNRDREYFKSMRESADGPVRPVISHRGQQMSARPMSAGNPCPPNADCARTLYNLDAAPCPARQGDPCAPKLPCPSDNCYPLPPSGASAQLPTAEWSEWSGCSASCGLAVKTRQCLGGFSCLGPSSLPCPMPDCSTWTLWSPWTLCSASCGVGEKQRTRICSSGRNCIGPSIEIEVCKALMPCPTWSSWTEWSGCTNSCGRGIERRSRICQNGLLCAGPPTEERACDMGPCPHWSPWGPWDQCSKECGGGLTYRTRECVDGSSCEGASEEKIFCNQQPCPEWSQWTAWTVCDNKCGEESIRLRNRKCLNAESNNSCEGPAQDQMNCPYRDCPKWEEWGEWTDCSTTCGQGTQKRTRKCDTDNECNGPPEEMRFCQIASCPYWGEWSQWTGCSVTCGRGVCERTRRCITDEFLHLPTLEELERDDSLEKHEAKEALIARAKTISSYRKTNETRFSPSRNSLLEQPLGGSCDGPDRDSKVCDAGPCCSWDKWSDWSPCIGCGRDGISKRNRICTIEGHSPAPPPLSFQEDHRGSYLSAPIGGINLDGLSPIIPVEVHRGKRQVLFGISAHAQCHCPGDSFQTRKCPEPIPCEDPVPRCEWSEWGEWCGCTRCRPGKEVRRRYCDRLSQPRRGPVRPDDTCDCGNGDDTEERNCPLAKECIGFHNLASLKHSSHERIESRTRFENYERHQSNGRDDFQRGGFVSSSHNRHSNGFHVERTHGESANERDEQYVPIDSVIGRVQLGGKAEPYGKKDSPDAFDTTEFPYKVCHWSKWSDWSSCHANSHRERKRFCVGDRDSELVSNCECIGKPMEEEICNSTGFIAQSREETDDEIESNLDKLLASGENDKIGGLELQDPQVESSIGNIECEWTRWSQWSVCTVSCGEGKRMRRRRCPCGEKKCGAGNDHDSEKCQGPDCSSASNAEIRRKPIFNIIPS